MKLLKYVPSKLSASKSRSVLLAIVSTLGALSSGNLHATVIVSPGPQTSVEGNQNNGYPFNIGQFSQFIPSGTQRYQQVYAASDFAAFTPGGEYINQIAFRPDAGGAAFLSTLPSVRIDLSTTAAAPDGLSNAFANNVGADNTIVFGGLTGAVLTLSSAFSGPPDGPKAFDIIINLTTPFFYNPAAGNLLLDVRNFGGGSTTQFDAQNSTDTISRVLTLSGAVNSPTADLSDTTGLIAQFSASSIPEPMTAGILGFGALLFAASRRCRS